MTYKSPDGTYKSPLDPGQSPLGKEVSRWIRSFPLGWRFPVGVGSFPLRNLALFEFGCTHFSTSRMTLAGSCGPPRSLPFWNVQLSQFRGEANSFIRNSVVGVLCCMLSAQTLQRSPQAGKKGNPGVVPNPNIPINRPSGPYVTLYRLMK